MATSGQKETGEHARERVPDLQPQSSGLQPPSSGVGPFIQRDYWAVIDSCRCRPSELVALLKARFKDLPPTDVVLFERADRNGETLRVGDELDIRIRLAGAARVRVVHTAPCSLTLATLEGHPEAGRITFGAYRNDEGDVVFHIRSRARSATLMSYLGFLVGGDPMQTSTWADFVNNVAVTAGERVKGEVHANSRILAPDEIQASDEQMSGPTFVAVGD